MPTVIASHTVKDVNHWLASTRRGEFFASVGVTDIRLFVNPENPNQVSVLMEVPDMDRVKAAMSTPEAAAAMEADGVQPETMVIYVAK